MSEVMKCDICGAIYDNKYENIRIEEKRTNGTSLNKYDLCLACVEKFHQWLDSSDNDPTVKEIDQKHNYIRWVDDLASNTRKVYSTRPLTREEQDAIIVEWTELKIPFNIEFVDPGEKL